MATAAVPEAKKLVITATIQDAAEMIAEAKSDIPFYAHDIVTIYERMPEFEYTYFCFYAYDSAKLFEHMLKPVDPKSFLSFSLTAPDAFFYTLYGGMCALYEQAKPYA